MNLDATITHTSPTNSNMDAKADTIGVFLINRLPKDKYCDANELASDIAARLHIDRAKIYVDLIASTDIKGDKGDRGEVGPTGKKGDVGPIGPTGLDGQRGLGLTWKGAWEVSGPGGGEEVVYFTNDIVAIGGSIYIAIEGNTATSSNQPGVGVDWEDSWELMATFSYPNNLTQLSDTPASYTGQQRRYLRVKAGEDGIEFVQDGDFTTVSTTNPAGGSKVPVMIGAFTVDGTVAATGYIRISVNGVNYKVLAQPL